MLPHVVRMVAGLMSIAMWSGAQPELVWCQSRTSARASIATRVALATIVSELASDVSEQVGVAVAPAWRLQLPNDTIGVDWPVIRAELGRLLRARPLRYSDQSWSELSVAGVRVTPDSVAFTFMVSGATRCGDDLVGSSTTYAVSLARATMRWKPHATPIVFSDGVGCAFPPAAGGVWLPPRLPPVPPVFPQVRPARIVPVPRGHAREP